MVPLVLSETCASGNYIAARGGRLPSGATTTLGRPVQERAGRMWIGSRRRRAAVDMALEVAAFKSVEQAARRPLNLGLFIAA